MTEWVRSARKVQSGYEWAPMRARYTWHLLRRGPNGFKAGCNMSIKVSDVVASAAPDGDRMCMVCEIRFDDMKKLASDGERAVDTGGTK